MNQSTTGSLAVRSSNDSRFVPNLHSVRQVQSRAVLALVHILFVHWHELSTSFHIHLGHSPICLRCRCFLLCTARVCLVQLQAYESKPGAWSRAVATSPRMVCVATRCFRGPWSDELLPRLDVEMAKFSENENGIREAIFKRCDMIWLLTAWHSNHLADAQDVNKAMRSMTPWPQNVWGKRPPTNSLSPEILKLQTLNALRWSSGWVSGFYWSGKSLGEHSKECSPIFLLKREKWRIRHLQKNTLITLDDQKGHVFQVYDQNHFNRASTGPQRDLKWD
jgi:hypothetical protein